MRAIECDRSGEIDSGIDRVRSKAGTIVALHPSATLSTRVVANSRARRQHRHHHHTHRICQQL
eukprot:8106334-Pyramimonas_sp.AAC.1